VRSVSRSKQLAFQAHPYLIAYRLFLKAENRHNSSLIAALPFFGNEINAIEPLPKAVHDLVGNTLVIRVGICHQYIAGEGGDPSSLHYFRDSLRSPGSATFFFSSPSQRQHGSIFGCGYSFFHCLGSDDKKSVLTGPWFNDANFNVK